MALPMLIVMAAAAAASAYSQYDAGRTAKRNAEHDAKVATNEALNAELESRENIRRRRVEARRFLAMQRARFAKSGVAEEGTPLEVMAETTGRLELEVLDYGREMGMRSDYLKRSAIAYRAAGRDAMRAGQIGAGASLLSGAAQMAAATYKPS